MYSSFIVRLVCFLLRLSCHSNVSKKFDFCFREFRKAIACLCVTHIAQISTDVVLYVEIYLGKRHWQKYITQQLNSVLFINMTKDLQYYILPRYAWNAIFLWIRPRREIYSTIFHLKHMKTGVPFDKHSYSMCGMIAKLTEETVHLFWNSASKSLGESKPIYNKEEKNWIMIC